MKHRLRLIAHLFALILALCATACGGGSTGTDGGVSLRMSGEIRDESGAALKDVSVTIEETGDGGVTNDEGLFQIDTQTSTKELTLLLERENRVTRAVVTLAGAQSGDVVSVSLVLDKERFEVSAVAVELNPVDVPPGSTPTPSVTPPPGADSREDLEVGGTVVTQSGRGIPGFTVGIEGTRSRMRTAADGSFLLRSGTRTVVLTISNKADTERVRLPEIPRTIERVRVRITLKFPPAPAGGIQSMSETRFTATARIRG